jgi:hypothetical protein
MSACLLSLSVMSLLLPVYFHSSIILNCLMQETDVQDQTAFHASFSDTTLADVAVLQVSRGSSIVSLQRSNERVAIDQLDTITGICALPLVPTQITFIHVPEHPSTCYRRRIAPRSVARYAQFFQLIGHLWLV